MVKQAVNTTQKEKDCLDTKTYQKLIIVVTQYTLTFWPKQFKINVIWTMIYFPANFPSSTKLNTPEPVK